MLAIWLTFYDLCHPKSSHSWSDPKLTVHQITGKWALTWLKHSAHAACKGILKNVKMLMLNPSQIKVIGVNAALVTGSTWEIAMIYEVFLLLEQDWVRPLQKKKKYKQVLRNWRVWNNRRDTSSLSKRHPASQTDSWHFTLQPRVGSGRIRCTRLRRNAKTRAWHPFKHIIMQTYISAWTQAKKKRVSDDGAVVGIPISAFLNFTLQARACLFICIHHRDGKTGCPTSRGLRHSLN